MRGLQLVHPAAELFQRANQRLDPLGAQAELFDQLHGPQPPPAEPPPGFVAQRHLGRLAGAVR